jgi:hypothetical protein
VIQQLIQLIISQLVSGLASVITTPATRITQGPIASPTLPQRPRLALEAGRLDWLQSKNDDTSGQPRNIEARERILVNVGTPAGPYLLGNQPLDGTVEVDVVYNEGLVTEYSETLLPGIDFSVNIPARQITIIKSIVGATALRVVYAFVGNASIREFEQALAITIYLDGWNDLNRLCGLTTAIVHSQQQLLLEQFNFQTPTSHAANNYFCQVQLQRIKLLSMTMPERTPSQAVNDIAVVLNFQAIGTERMGVSLSGGFGLIESIHSRDQSGPGVNITPGLG